MYVMTEYVDSSRVSKHTSAHPLSYLRDSSARTICVKLTGIQNKFLIPVKFCWISAIDQWSTCFIKTSMELRQFIKINNRKCKGSNYTNWKTFKFENFQWNLNTLSTNWTVTFRHLFRHFLTRELFTETKIILQSVKRYS